MCEILLFVMYTLICAIKTWKNISASFIFAGGDPLVLFEGTDKIAQIIKAIPIGNLCDGIIGGSQLAAGLLDPLAVEVIHWCLMRHLGKRTGRNIWETWKPKRKAPAG